MVGNSSVQFIRSYVNLNFSGTLRSRTCASVLFGNNCLQILRYRNRPTGSFGDKIFDGDCQMYWHMPLYSIGWLRNYTSRALRRILARVNERCRIGLYSHRIHKTNNLIRFPNVELSSRLKSTGYYQVSEHLPVNLFSVTVMPSSHRRRVYATRIRQISSHRRQRCELGIKMKHVVTYVGPEVGCKTRDLLFCPIKIGPQLSKLYLHTHITVITLYKTRHTADFTPGGAQLTMSTSGLYR